VRNLRKLAACYGTSVEALRSLASPTDEGSIIEVIDVPTIQVIAERRRDRVSGRTPNK
jgi:hypothetical protein